MPNSGGRRVSERSTTDLLILLIASTICIAVLAAGATTALVKVIHPEVNIDFITGKLSDVVNTMIGLLAGFLAGRTDAAQQAAKQQQERQAPEAPSSERT